jgi:hypothetical protein
MITVQKTVYSKNPHTTDDLKMAITEYIRNVDRAMLNAVFENTVRRVTICLETAGDTLNITCNFLYCDHQVHRDFWIILYVWPKISSHRTLYKQKHMLLRNGINVTKSVLFWDFTLIRILGSYRRFGRNYQSQLQNSNSLKRTVLVCLTFEDGTE